MIALLLISDGRQDYLERTLRSMADALPRFGAVVHVDDSLHVLGFAGAVQHGWERVQRTGADHVFHLEGDFTFNESVPIDRMVAALRDRPGLAQVSLKRQPCNPKELAAGGIVEADPDSFTEITVNGDVLTEHRRYFTTNPSIYPVELCRRGWPQVPNSEGIFSHTLLKANPDTHFAIWGGKHDPPRVHHIGNERAGHGY